MNEHQEKTKHQKPSEKHGGCGCEDGGGGCATGLEAQILEARAAAAQNLELAKYKQAELENYIKRQREATANAFNDGKILVVMGVLPVLDSFSDAIKLMGDDKCREGVEILYRKFESILESLGLEEIKTSVGEAFNPHVHNCAATSENSDNKIKEVWQKGYKLGGRTVRPVTVRL